MTLIDFEISSLHFCMPPFSGDTTDSSVPSTASSIDGRSPKSRVRFEQYQDPSREFDSQTLKYGMWFVTHRLLLYRILVGGLISLAVIFFAIAGWYGWREVSIVLSDQGAFNRDLRTFPDYTSLQPRFSAQPLQVVNPAVFVGGANKYDLVAEITNPNERFSADIEYAFTVNGEAAPALRTVLLPGERRPVALLGFESVAYPSAVNLEIKQIRWQRISNHDIANPAGLQAERLNFGMSGFVFAAAGDGADSATVSFALSNNSPYSYANAEFYAGLYNQESLIGVIPFTLNRFISQSNRQVDVRSFTPNLYVTDVRVFPLINVYDQEVYLEPEK